ncbi:Abi family protein [Pseudomonas frederiksbergensis]|uniref:CAAX protease n=1 Tax=Pseudomonas frederiksbergensis TaxID=104087 RepID=A0A423KNJ2_9PSED|nr:Abi family protein [Pseudomonas frederiksbergensis]RON55956.1 hypothetical protein BK665_08310 [Pseudomonas frederiksbergensis]
MRPLDVDPFIKALSTPRLRNYRSYFNAVDDHDVYACYQWNNEVSRSLVPLIHLVEIVMRNAYHKELSRFHSQRLNQPIVDSMNWYDHLSLTKHNDGGLSKTLKKLKKKSSFTDHDVVSNLTFGFWTNISKETNTQWGVVLPLVFPNTNRNFSLAKNTDWLEARVGLVNDIRNRISHWEPIWKRGDLMEERVIRPGSAPLKVAHLAPTTPEQSIQRVNTEYDRTLSLLAMMDKDLAAGYTDSHNHEHFKWVCSEEGLSSYRAYKRRATIPFSMAKRNLSSLVKGQTMLTITHGGVRFRITPLNA